MKFTINAEFSDDELKKHAEDVGRRWALNFIHDMINHVGAMKLPKLDKKSAQELAAALVAAVKAAVQGADTKKGENPDLGGDWVGPPQDGPFAHAAPTSPRQHCTHSRETPEVEACWFCCKCNAMNNDFRKACRTCNHERCDDAQQRDPGPRASSANAHEDDGPIRA